MSPKPTPSTTGEGVETPALGAFATSRSLKRVPLELVEGLNRRHLCTGMGTGRVPRCIRCRESSRCWIGTASDRGGFERDGEARHHSIDHILGRERGLWASTSHRPRSWAA
jgi:hypothetical protein